MVLFAIFPHPCQSIMLEQKDSSPSVCVWIWAIFGAFSTIWVQQTKSPKFLRNSTGPVCAHLPWKLFLFFQQGRTNGLSEPIHLAVLPALLQGAKFGQMWPGSNEKRASDVLWLYGPGLMEHDVHSRVEGRDVAHTIESIYQYYSNKVYSGRTCM